MRLAFCDTYENAEKFFTHMLKLRYDVIIDNENPEVVIFGDSNFGTSHTKFDKNRVKKVFFTGENVRPNYGQSNWAITFDFEYSPRHFRLPLWVLEIWAYYEDDYLSLGRSTNNNRFLFPPPEGFTWEEKKYVKPLLPAAAEVPQGDKKFLLGYVQSNPRCMIRNRIIDEFNARGLVGCGGPHMNNMGFVVPRNRTAKIRFLDNFMFSAAFENGSYPGYVTEKLFDAYMSHSIPVYWGSDHIYRDFDIDSMIYVNEYIKNKQLDINGLIDKMLNIADNKPLYMSMFNKSPIRLIDDISKVDRYLNAATLFPKRDGTTTSMQNLNSWYYHSYINPFLNWFDEFVIG